MDSDEAHVWITDMSLPVPIFLVAVHAYLESDEAQIWAWMVGETDAEVLERGRESVSVLKGKKMGGKVREHMLGGKDVMTGGVAEG